MRSFLTRTKRSRLPLQYRICAPAIGVAVLLGLGARTVEAQVNIRIVSDVQTTFAPLTGGESVGPCDNNEVPIGGFQITNPQEDFLIRRSSPYYNSGADRFGWVLNFWNASSTETMGVHIVLMCAAIGPLGTPSASYWSAAGANIFYSGGNVGIGTTPPGAKLDVAGNIKTSGEVYTYHYTEDDFALSGGVYSKDIVTGMRMNAIEVSGGGNGPAAGGVGRHWGFGGRIAFGYGVCTIDVTRSNYPLWATYPTITCTALASGFMKVTLQIPQGDGAGGDWDIYIRQLSPAH